MDVPWRRREALRELAVRVGRANAARARAAGASAGDVWRRLVLDYAILVAELAAWEGGATPDTAAWRRARLWHDAAYLRARLAEG